MQGFVTIYRWQHGFIQQAGLTQKQGFYLKDIITMLAGRHQGNMHPPLLKGFAVDAKSKAPGKRNKQCVFPVTVQTFGQIHYAACLILKPLCCQPVHPIANGNGRQLDGMTIARHIRTRPVKLIIMLLDIRRDMQNHLLYLAPFRRKDFAIVPVYNMKHHIVICHIRVVAMPFPITARHVNLDIAGPKFIPDFQLRINKVRTCIIVVQTGRYHLDRLATGRMKRTVGIYPMLPNIMQKSFHGAFRWD